MLLRARTVAIAATLPATRSRFSRRHERRPGRAAANHRAGPARPSDFRRQLQKAAEQPEVRLIVLEASAIDSIDYTAARALASAISACHARNCDFAIARLESVRAYAALQASGVMEALSRPETPGESRIFHSVDEALRRLAPAEKAVK